MNRKTKAIIVASVLAAPLMVVQIGRAGGSGLEFEKGFCLTPAGAPMVGKCLAPNNRGEGEVEYSQRLSNGFTKSRLSGEVEVKILAVNGVRGTLPTDADITIEPIVPPVPAATLPTFGAPIMCAFVNPPLVKDIFNTAVPPALLATKVAFNGSLSQSTDPTAVLPTATLDCGAAELPILLKGSKVTIGVNSADVVTGTLKLDD